MSPSATRSAARRRGAGTEIEVPDLYAALRELLGQVPCGRVTTYGALAEALGAVAAARWVASCLLDPEGPRDVPRHRVVLRDGTLGKIATGDLQKKKHLLATEGVAVKNEAVDLAQFGFKDFQTSRPLNELQQVQERLLSRLVLKPPRAVPALVAGVDVSYVGKSNAGPVDGFAGYALVDVESGNLVWSLTVRDAVRFPYIPGFLAFRELPILLKLLSEVRRRGRLAEVVMVDGNGILHQRHAGIASHLGVVAALPTIGIGKSLLCGRIDRSGTTEENAHPVVFQGDTVARAIRNRLGSRPVFVSPGHLADLPFAAALARRMFREHRVPEPIFHAHTISRRAARGG